MSNKSFTLKEIKEKLACHYGRKDDNMKRDMIVKPFIDDHGTVGSIHISLSGSPPKGFAIYSFGILSLYDLEGKRFKYYRCEIDDNIIDNLYMVDKLRV